MKLQTIKVTKRAVRKLKAASKLTDIKQYAFASKAIEEKAERIKV